MTIPDWLADVFLYSKPAHTLWTCLVLYWTIRLAVRHERTRASPPPGVSLRSGSGAAKIGDTIHVNANSPEEAAEFVARLEAKRSPEGDL